MPEPTKETSEPIKEKIDMEHFEEDMNYFMEHFNDEYGYELIIPD